MILIDENSHMADKSGVAASRQWKMKVDANLGVTWWHTYRLAHHGIRPARRCIVPDKLDMMIGMASWLEGARGRQQLGNC